LRGPAGGPGALCNSLREGRMAQPVLEVLDVTRRFGATTALDGVTLQVEEGEIFGLLGPNGAGKTTLLSILSCLLAPTSGRVRLLGRELRLADLGLRRLIGIVPQELAVYGELTARENLAFFGALYGLGGAELSGRVEEVLSAVGLRERADARTDTFSGGMKRRLNLGAALMHGPRLLLLDEPTAGVDPQSRNHIFEEVRRLNGRGATVVYTSHYMEEVQALCTRVGIIDRGRLVACDTLEGLLRRLRGLVRFRVDRTPAGLRERLARLPDAEFREAEGGALELACRDVHLTVPRLVALLNELEVGLLSLETQEPNLERVFLHLTGRALRD
jgi:ABC-2 type transport system ATP-binding protein